MTSFGQDEACQSFGSFDLLERIGSGGAATVHRARNRATGQIVAVKIGACELCLDNDAFERFKREFTEICHIRHPNLVGAYDFGLHERAPYLVLELVEGESLEQRLKERGAISLAEAVPIFQQVVAGLRFLHQKKIAHRDIKPGNILLTPRGEVKVADFGILKVLRPEPGITISRQAIGTPEFGAPEQFENAKYTDVRCDLYSLAATLYAALTGLFPFGSGSLRRIMQRKLRNKFAPLRRVKPAIPKELDEIVTRALMADRDRRPATVDEFEAVLTKIEDDLTSGAISLESNELPMPALTGSRADRRDGIRASVKVPAAFVPFHQNKRVSFRATILDISPGGLCLQTNESAPLHTLLEITAAINGELYLAEVRWTKQISDGSHILGCSFACLAETRNTPGAHAAISNSAILDS